MKLGHHDDLHIAGKIERPRRSDRVAVNRLEDQLDVELGCRPVEMREAMDELRQHMRLAIEGHEDGVDGKLGVGHP